MAKYSILIIKTIERFHTGAGEATGIIDNPLIRERITEFPFIQGSSIKGVLRDNASDKGIDVEALFGPEPGRGEEHAGAVYFSDAQILAMPIRSLKGGFVWATSPLILYRLADRIKIAGLSIPSLDLLLSKMYPQNIDAIICEGSNEILLFKNDLFLEEHKLKTQESHDLKKFAQEIARIIFSDSDDEKFLKTQFEQKLVILSEEYFKYFVKYATEVIPNIRIGDKGTTAEGSLRYTEYLPQETILYSLITFEKSRKPNSNLPEDQVSSNFDGLVTALPTIKFGGDKTTGKGLVRLKIWRE